MMTNFFCFLFYFVILNQFVNSQTVDVVNKPNPLPPSSDVIRIITQSCNYQYYKKNYLWQYMVALEPDLITLLGDTVYLDGRPCDDETENCRTMFDLACDVVDCDQATDISCFNYCWADTNWYEDPMVQYNYLLNDTQFTLNKVYNKSTWPVPVFAIWDDHDYCRDNSNATCKYKNRTRDAYVEFLRAIDQKGVLTNVLDELAQNTAQGIYYTADYVKVFSDDRSLKLRLYMMDDRWYRSDKDLLGTQQKAWFESLMSKSDIGDINYHIVCVGSTYYTTFGFVSSLAEPWPDSTKKWFENVTSIAGIRDRLILLTGDVHYSAIYRSNNTFEIVTSAMTHGIYDLQARLMEEIQNSDGFLITNIIDVENIGVLDIGFDGFELTYLNQSGLPIVKFSYNYETGAKSYTIIQKDFQNQQHILSTFWDTKGKWIVVAIAIAIFVLCVTSIIYCWCRKKTSLI